jgi:hypothetical protein
MMRNNRQEARLPAGPSCGKNATGGNRFQKLRVFGILIPMECDASLFQMRELGAESGVER